MFVTSNVAHRVARDEQTLTLDVSCTSIRLSSFAREEKDDQKPPRTRSRYAASSFLSSIPVHDMHGSPPCQLQLIGNYCPLLIQQFPVFVTTRGPLKPQGTIACNINKFIHCCSQICTKIRRSLTNGYSTPQCNPCFPKVSGSLVTTSRTKGVSARSIQ